MLPLRPTDIVLWLHVLTACVWIGGQVAVAVLIPLLRGHAGLPAAAGRRYQLVAFPAFATFVVTGIFNARNAGISWGDLVNSPAGRTLTVKLGLVLVSGAAAGVHAFVQAPRARHKPVSPRWSAALGGVSLLSAIAAALFGVVIAEG